MLVKNNSPPSLNINSVTNNILSINNLKLFFMKSIEFPKNELFNKYILPEKDFICRLCRKYSKSEYEYQEYHSEVMFRIFSGIETYNPELHIRPWLYTIIQRIIAKSWSEQNKLLKTDFVDVENLSFDPIESETSSNFMGIDNYQQFYSDDILQALNMINPISRNAILLQQSGYKLKEIADKLYATSLIKNNSTASVKYHLRIGKM